jgi:REP element-mobilizing transposase RayT
LLQIPPKVSVSKVVQALKGATSRVLRARAEFPEPELEEFL